MRFLAILAVLFGVTAGAVALGDPEARPVPRRVQVPLAQVRGTVVFEVLEAGSKPSGIRDLPVPASAVRAHGDDECFGAAGCAYEVWSLDVDDDVLRAWYREHIDPLDPWRDWESCVRRSGLVGDAAHMGGYYRWVNERTALDIQLRGRSTILVREQRSGHQPCE